MNAASPPLKLDHATFGDSPAALYLTVLINERGDRALNRKVSRLIAKTREMLNDVAACHLETDQMLLGTFSSLVELISAHVKAQAANLPDHFIGHLVLNILTGEIRTLKNRSINAKRTEQNVHRKTPEGVSAPFVKALPTPDELGTEERNRLLKKKSAAYLARKGKRNTLY